MGVATITHRFTVDDYYKMVEAGILDEDARVELIEGEVVEMSPIGKKHIAEVDHLTHLFVLGLGEKAVVRVQGPIRLSQYSQPEPDLLLLRWRADFYADIDAGPEDVLLLVEVADSSLAYDRDVKVSLYARSGIPEFWLFDISDKSIRIHRGPEAQGYREVFTVRGGERLSPRAFPEIVLTAGEILG